MQTPDDGGAEAVVRTLGLGARPARRRWLGWLLLAVAGLLLWWLWPADPGAGGQGSGYRTEVARQGDLSITVTATGTLEPVNQVDVGSELSGLVEAVEVDYNDRVTRGQVLARLNTDRLAAQRVQAQAQLQAALAQREEARATRLEAQLKHQRCQRLADRQLCAQEELDSTRAALARADAGVSSAEAQIAVARAALAERETDLDKALIRAPIDGVVLQREVEPGQTVAASLQTPVLFVLAENLAQLALQIGIDEADVGLVREGQKASFSVDAWPDREFAAQITQLRYAPQTVDGVVTYQSLLAVDNAEGLLRPGMTATAEILVQALDDVLLVPNAALRFRMPASAPSASASGLFSRLMPRPPSQRKPANGNTDADGRQQVWVLREGQPQALGLRLGASDGRWTQVLAGELAAGEALITGLIRP